MSLVFAYHSFLVSVAFDDVHGASNGAGGGRARVVFVVRCFALASVVARAKKLLVSDRGNTRFGHVVFHVPEKNSRIGAKSKELGFIAFVYLKAYIVNFAVHVHQIIFYDPEQ